MNLERHRVKIVDTLSIFVWMSGVSVILLIVLLYVFREARYELLSSNPINYGCIMNDTRSVYQESQHVYS